jgi:hypothetical protein
MNIHRKLNPCGASIGVLWIAAALLSVDAGLAVAQNDHSHGATSPKQEMTLEQQANQDTLLRVVRDATQQFQDVKVAEAKGYALQFGCVTGSDEGAMGLHYVNGDLINSGVIDATKPQIVIYEPLPGGGLQLIGADYLVMADMWNAHHSSPPQLMGQLFHLFDAPNRFGLPAFYTLHVWAWKKNPKGTFVNWHPNVSCQSFTAQ